MMDAGILDGDLVVVEKAPAAERGDIVVAIVDNQFTLKRLDVDRGEFILKPENKAYPVDPARRRARDLRRHGRAGAQALIGGRAPAPAEAVRPSRLSHARPRPGSRRTSPRGPGRSAPGPSPHWRSPRPGASLRHQIDGATTHARARPVGDRGVRGEAAAIVEDRTRVAVGDAARRGVVRVESQARRLLLGDERGRLANDELRKLRAGGDMNASGKRPRARGRLRAIRAAAGTPAADRGPCAASVSDTELALARRRREAALGERRVRRPAPQAREAVLLERVPA